MSFLQRTSPYPMLTVAEATQRIITHALPLGTEELSSLTADGRVLAEDINAADPMPDLPRAMVDGYALRAADGMQERQVTHNLTAGTAGSEPLAPGTAARIMTGGTVPPGADTVVMVEQTEEQAGRLRLRQAVRQGQHIAPVGEDLAQGERVLPRGTMLGAPEIGLLAAVGRARVRVYRRPQVAVLSTGDELVEIGTPRAPGLVYDSNRPALLAAVREAGCTALSLGSVHDDMEEQRAAILRGLEQADVLITSGGVSMGTRDLVKPLLAEMGTIHFGRSALKPGKPTTFATVGGKLVFGMPGFPVSSLVAFEVYVRPALRRLQGAAHPERPRLRVTLADLIEPARERVEYQRVVIIQQNERLVAHSTGAQHSSRLLSLRDANGLLIVPAGEEPYAPGSQLEALLTGPFYAH